MTKTKSNSVVKNAPNRRQPLKAATVASLVLVALMFSVGNAHAGVIYPLEVVNDNDYAIRIRVECNDCTRTARIQCVYVLNDEEIGLFSDEVVVNCAP